MVVDGNKIRDIFLGNDRDRVLQGVRKTGLGSQQGFWNDLFGGAFDSYVEVDSVQYSADNKSCVVKKGNNEYIVTQGKLSFKQDLGVDSYKDRYNFTQIVVDENGYTQCNITSETLYGVKAQISKVNDASQVDIFLNTIAKNKEWWKDLDLSSMSGAEEFVKYMQENIFSHELHGDPIDALERLEVKQGKSFDRMDFVLWKKKMMQEYQEDFLEGAADVLTDEKYKPMVEALKQFDEEKIKFIVDYVEKNATAEQTASAGLGDNWARLTSDHRVDKSLKR